MLLFSNGVAPATRHVSNWSHRLIIGWGAHGLFWSALALPPATTHAAATAIAGNINFRIDSPLLSPPGSSSA